MRRLLLLPVAAIDHVPRARVDDTPPCEHTPMTSYEQAVRAYPRDAIFHSNLGVIYLASFHQMLLVNARMRGDAAAVEKETRWFAGKTEEYMGLIIESGRAMMLGQPHRARALLDRAAELMRGHDLKELPAEEPVVRAMVDGVLAGTFPPVPLPPGVPPGIGGPLAVLVSGQTLLSEEKGQEGAAEFQKILDMPKNTFYPFAYAGVARGAAMAGDIERAKKSYEALFTLWKDAEPDVPLLVRAREEYAAVQAGKPLPPLASGGPTTRPDAAATPPVATGRWVAAAFPNVVMTLDDSGATLTGSSSADRRSRSRRGASRGAP